MKHLLLAAGLLLLGCYPAGAAGFQWATVPDPEDAPLQVAIWYPSDDQVADNLVGPFDMDVALNGKVSGTQHPLVVMSHGTGGMALNSYDTAIALADAGFVVVAVTHTGDNYRDQTQLSYRYASDSRNAPENCGLLRPLSICGAKNHCPFRGHLALTGSTLMCWRRCSRNAVRTVGRRKSRLDHRFSLGALQSELPPPWHVWCLNRSAPHNALISSHIFSSGGKVGSKRILHPAAVRGPRSARQPGDRLHAGRLGGIWVDRSRPDRPIRPFGGRDDGADHRRRDRRSRVWCAHSARRTRTIGGVSRRGNAGPQAMRARRFPGGIVGSRPLSWQRPRWRLRSNRPGWPRSTSRCSFGLARRMRSSATRP